MTTVVFGLAVGTWLLAIVLFGACCLGATRHEYVTGDESFRRVSKAAAGVAAGSFVLAPLS